VSQDAGEPLKTRSKVLFLTSAHPGGRGAIGAGEGICESSLRALVASGHEVHVLSFAASNQACNPEVVALCASYTTLVHSSVQSVLAMVRSLRWGSLFAPWFFTRVSPRNVGVVRSALVQHGICKVWIDFPSSLGFAPLLDAYDIDYFVHDVVSQKVGRKWLQRVLKPLVESTEQRLMSFVQRCLVLSEKDAGLLRGLGFGGEIIVSPPKHIKVGSVPNAVSVSTVVAGFAGGLNLVFFGNMSRPENHWSIVHFLLLVYPSIRRAHPQTRLWILGLGARRLLKLVARWIGGTHVVGAVDDPTQAFVQATLCIAPLRNGAGVKIKVLQMLEAGAVVIATPIGAEGVAAKPELIVVEEHDFAGAVIDFLDSTQASTFGALGSTQHTEATMQDGPHEKRVL